jgi:glycosyltransferase involved in cell wall biosynthesis
MKVMYVCTTGGSGRRQLGGAERILTQLIPAIAERGVDVVACVSDDDVASSLRKSGVAWINMGARSRVDMGYVREIGSVVDSFAPDVVCTHLLSAAMHSRAALGLSRRKTQLVVTLHNSLWQTRGAASSLPQKAAIQSNIAIDGLLRRLRPHATVAVSRFEATELEARGWVKNVHTIPNSLPPEWGSAARAAEPDWPTRVGYLGRHEWEKGIDFVPEIAALLPDIRFKVAGRGSMSPAPGPNIDVVGQVDAAEFLRQVDCLVVPSRVESFGLSALEAIAMGVPVVHSGVGGLAEVTEAADGVLAFRAQLDPAAMASAIRLAITAAPAGRRLAVADRYAKEYTFTTFVDRWHNLYRTLTHAAH